MGTNNKEKKDKDNRHKHPFHNDIQTCGDCGGYCLIHQQFTLENNVNFSEETVVPVYEANGFEPACTPGQPSDDGSVSTQVTETVFPFGTLIVSNIGVNAFNVTVVAENEDDSITRNIPPGKQIAFLGVIRRVDAIYPPQPIRALFHFDLFLTPPSPI